MESVVFKSAEFKTVPVHLTAKTTPYIRPFND